MRRILGLLCALSLLAGVAGCSSSGGDERATTGDAGGSSTTEAVDDETTTTETDDGTTTTTDAGSGSRTEEEYVSNLEQGFADPDRGEGDLVMSAESAACAAPRWVEAIGVDALVDADVAPEDLADPDFDLTGTFELDTDQAEAMVDALLQCDVDLYDQVLAKITEGLTDEQATCVTDALDPDRIRATMIAGIAGPGSDPEIDAFYEDLASTCELS